MIVFFQLEFLNNVLKLVVFLAEKQEELVELIWQHGGDFNQIAPNIFVWGNMVKMFLSKEESSVAAKAAILTTYFDLPPSAFNETQTMLNCSIQNY